MKKMLVFGLVAAAGVTAAFASSLGVPWFVDNAAANVGIPPNAATGTAPVLALVYLHNNESFDLQCSITYFTEAGVPLTPTPINTFTVPANSSVAFRPVAFDPANFTGLVDMFGAPVTGATNGQEGQKGLLVPDRPTTVGTPVGNDGKKNGSIKITWSAPGTTGSSIQGMYTSVQTVGIAPTGRLANTVPLIVSTSILLPPGA